MPKARQIYQKTLPVNNTPTKIQSNEERNLPYVPFVGSALSNGPCRTFGFVLGMSLPGPSVLEDKQEPLKCKRCLGNYAEIFFRVFGTAKKAKNQLMLR